MSLEAAIQENTKAINALAALITGAKATFDVEGATAAAKAAVAAASEKRGTKVVHAPKPEAPAQAEQSTAEATPPKSTAATSAPAATGPLDYVKDVQALTRKVAADKGRETLVAIFTEFGVEKGPQIPVEKLPELVKKLNAALA